MSYLSSEQLIFGTTSDVETEQQRLMQAVQAAVLVQSTSMWFNQVSRFMLIQKHAGGVKDNDHRPRVIPPAYHPSFRPGQSGIRQQGD